jgi:DNA topoisomerase-1
VPRLRRSDCSAQGLTRVKKGRGFQYLWADGRPVRDPDTLARIRGLAIPPAWRDVWICPWPNGHIQATGTDAAGRRQYRYHDAWREHRDREKFARVLALGRSIEVLRARVAEDLARPGMDRERVLAAAVRLLDLGCFRIGGEQYAAEHETFGVATLRREHVKVRGDTMLFSFPAKGAKWQEVAVRDQDLLPVVATLARRRSGGPDLLCYKQGRRWVDVRSEDVNAYVKDAAGGDFTAKDFRTWSATVLCAAFLAEVDPVPASGTARRRAVSSVVRRVAEHLGNTPAVCRSSYIDPRVLDRFSQEETIAPALAGLREPGSPEDPAMRDAVDRAVVALLDEESPPAAVPERSSGTPARAA